MHTWPFARSFVPSFFFLSLSLFLFFVYIIFIHICARTHVRAPLFVIMSHRDPISRSFFFSFTFYNRAWRISSGARERDCSRFSTQNRRERRTIDDDTVFPFLFLSFSLSYRSMKEKTKKKTKKKKENKNETIRCSSHQIHSTESLESDVRLLRKYEESNKDDTWLINVV